RRLLEVVKVRGEHTEDLALNALTSGGGRRFAPYKRAELLLRERGRLTKLLQNTKSPVQLLFAGKSHPADQHGNDIIARIRHRPPGHRRSCRGVRSVPPARA